MNLHGKAIPEMMSGAHGVTPTAGFTVLFFRTKKKFFLSLDSPDDIPHENILGILIEDVPAARPFAPLDHPDFFQAVKELLQVGMGYPFPFLV